MPRTRARDTTQSDSPGVATGAGDKGSETSKAKEEKAKPVLSPQALQTRSETSKAKEEKAKPVLSPQALQTLVGKVQKLKALPTGVPLKVHIVDKETLRLIATNPNIQILRQINSSGGPGETGKDDTIREDADQSDKDETQPSTSQESKMAKVLDISSSSPKKGGKMKIGAGHSPSPNKGGMSTAQASISSLSPKKWEKSPGIKTKAKAHSTLKSVGRCSKPPGFWTEEILDKAIGLLVSGVPYTETADDLNVSVHSLRQKIRPVVYMRAMDRTKDSEDQESDAFNIIKAEISLPRNANPTALPSVWPKSMKREASTEDSNRVCANGPDQSKPTPDKNTPQQRAEIERKPQISHAALMPNLWTQEMTDRAVKLLVGGMTYLQVEEELGVPQRRIMGKIRSSLLKEAIEKAKDSEDPELEAFRFVKADLEKLKPSTKPTVWAPENMVKALELVRHGAPLADTSRRCQIPVETLRCRTKRKDFQIISDKYAKPSPAKKQRQSDNTSESLEAGASDLTQVISFSQDSTQPIEGQVILGEHGEVSSMTVDFGKALGELATQNLEDDIQIEVVLAEGQSSQNATSDTTSPITEEKYDPASTRLWTEEGMEQAIKLYHEGMPLRTAARKFYIPTMTLRSRMRNRPLKMPKLEPEKSRLKREDELHLRDYILKMIKQNEIVTHEWIRQLAREMSIVRGKPFGPKSPAHSWWSSFKARYPVFEGVNIPTVREYIKAHVPPPSKKKYNAFPDARAALESLRLIDKPERIYSLDECCLGGVEGPCIKPRVIFPQAEDDGSPVDHVTITNCLSAEGTWLPPLFTFKDTLPQTHEYMFNGPANSINMTNDTGRPNKQSYLLYIKHLEPFLSPERPVVIFHPNILRRQANKELSDFCKEHQIHLMSIRRSENHNMQPLDHFYDKYKSAIEGRYTEASLLLSPMVLDKGKIPIIIRFAMQAMSEQGLLTEAFRVTGLYPFNSSLIRAMQPPGRSSDPTGNENASAISSILPGDSTTFVPSVVVKEDKETQTEPPVVQLSFKTTEHDEGATGYGPSTSKEITMDVAYLPRDTKNTLAEIKRPEVKLPPINLEELIPKPSVFLDQQIAAIEREQQTSRAVKRKVKQAENQFGLVDDNYMCLTCQQQAEEVWICQLCSQTYHTSCYKQSHDFSTGICCNCAKGQGEQAVKVYETKDDMWNTF